jgi:hypothetical protein
MNKFLEWLLITVIALLGVWIVACAFVLCWSLIHDGHYTLPPVW